MNLMDSHSNNFHNYSLILLINHNQYQFKMQNLQQTVLGNFSKVSKYNGQSHSLKNRKYPLAKFRKQQIMNEFELVDFKGEDKLSKSHILQYLNEKYQWINSNIVEELFSEMEWDSNGCVEKQQFCSKYLNREVEVYHEMIKLESFRKRLYTIRHIYETSKPTKPALYVWLKITKIYIKSDKRTDNCADLEIFFEDHDTKMQFTIVEETHYLSQPSLQILLPTQKSYFFVRYHFKKEGKLIGQCYINMEVPEKGELKKKQRIKVDVLDHNNTIGYCQFFVHFESDPLQVQEKIEDEYKILPEAENRAYKLKQEYEYLQFMWGIRHKPPPKMTEIEATWLVAFRIILTILLGLIGTVIHALGRCEPICIIVCFMLAKNWKYVIVLKQKFLMTWLTLASILLDIVWLTFASHHASQINFLKIGSPQALTFVLIAVKVLAFMYLVLFEKSFNEGEQA